MRALRFLNVAMLSLLVGSAALVYAQDEKQQEEKPARQEEAKPKQQEEMKPPRHEEAKPSKPDKQMEKQEPKREEQSRDQAMPEKNKNKQEHPEMKGEHARPAGKGGHIPDDKFRAHFGQSHHFNAKNVIQSGQTQFVYGGYTFELIDVWPADWAYTDDVYIDYIDDHYYLIDLLHPGVRIALFVVM